MALIEQEVKIALEAESFARLKSGLGLDGVAPRQQVNHYYDSNQSALKAARAALRLRQYEQVSEWTFKQALDQFQALEITQTNAGRLDSVPASLAGAWIQDASLLAAIAKVGLEPQDLVLRYGFQTNRWTLDLGWGELVLDQTLYGDQADYELELEAQDLHLAQDYIAKLSQNYDFPLLAADKKIARVSAYYAKLEKNKWASGPLFGVDH